jgi:hypothetical protein
MQQGLSNIIFQFKKGIRYGMFIIGVDFFFLTWGFQCVDCGLDCGRFIFGLQKTDSSDTLIQEMREDPKNTGLLPALSFIIKLTCSFNGWFCVAMNKLQETNRLGTVMAGLLGGLIAATLVPFGLIVSVFGIALIGAGALLGGAVGLVIGGLAPKASLKEGDEEYKPYCQKDGLPPVRFRGNLVQVPLNVERPEHNVVQLTTKIKIEP